MTPYHIQKYLEGSKAHHDARLNKIQELDSSY